MSSIWYMSTRKHNGISSEYNESATIQPITAPAHDIPVTIVTTPLILHIVNFCGSNLLFFENFKLRSRLHTYIHTH